MDRQKLLDCFNQLKCVSGVSPDVDVAPLRKLWDEKKYTELCGQIRNIMGLNMRLRVGYVNTGGPLDASAWISIPQDVPLFGTEQFKKWQATIFFKKSFLVRAPFESFVLSIAHEMSHVVLYAIRHPLRHSEEATDIFAMLRGFSGFFMQGHSYTIENLEHACAMTSTLGYLTFNEVAFLRIMIARTAGI